jgi:hypothetical protein
MAVPVATVEAPAETEDSETERSPGCWPGERFAGAMAARALKASTVFLPLDTL